MTTTWILLIICFGCGEPAARREYPSLRSCQEAVERGQFMAGPGVADAMAVQWTDYVAERIAA